MKPLKLIFINSLVTLAVMLSFNSHALNPTTTQLIGTAGNAKIYVDSANIFSDKIDNWDLDLFFLTSENPSIVIEKLKSKCHYCLNNKEETKAIFSIRLSKEIEQIVIGNDNYKPVCRNCYEKYNI